MSPLLRVVSPDDNDASISEPVERRLQAEQPVSDQQPVSEEQVLGQYIPLLYHYNMLQDEDRVGAFQSAIQQTVRAGMHVVELGGGTGILSSFAARCGARVTCVERNPELVAHAQRFVQLNGLQDQIQVVQADATEFTPESPVDVVVCEMLHVGLLREKQAQVIAAFKQNYRQRFSDPLPVFMPEVSLLMLQPVCHDFSFAGYLAPVPSFQAPVQDQPRTAPLADFLTYAQIDYAVDYGWDFQGRVSCIAAVDGQMNAIRFATQNVLAIDLEQCQSTNWANQCLVIPLEEACSVRAGQVIDIDLNYRAGQRVEELMDGGCRVSVAARAAA